MPVDTKTVMDKVLSTIRNDEALSSYVKKISHGDMNFSRKTFPFIEVGNFSFTEHRQMQVNSTITYQVDIYAGTSSLAPGVAYEGAESGTKGIVELCEDIMQLCVNNSFNGAFIMPVVQVDNNPRFLLDKSESICIGKLSFSGIAWL